VRLTKLGHACVRLQDRGTTVLVDPGAFSGGDLYADANAVLVTHEHFDHLDREALAAAMRSDTDLEVWTCPAVAEQLGELGSRIHPVSHGDRFEVGALDVHVYGEKHAPTHLAPVANVGFLIADEVFHPGDAFTVPDERAPTLLLPTNAPWLRSTDVVEFAHRISPARAYSIHDGLVNDIGQKIIDNIIAAARPAQPDGDFRRIPVGDSVDF
jgi:L-ascorbate metabolism protein UlaG (beta-lactamase superfamily)